MRHFVRGCNMGQELQEPALRYRERAAEMLRHSERAENEHLKLYYVEMARSWSALADQAERNTADRNLRDPILPVSNHTEIDGSEDTGFTSARN